MFSLKNILLFFVFFLIHSFIIAQDTLYFEEFAIAEKGYWGGGSDMSGITTWTIDVSNCNFVDDADYVKTVSTSGGRIEDVQSNGEAIWASSSIDISGYTHMYLSVNTSETGSSINSSKYVKVYYKLDGGSETLFETNGESIGNWGSATTTQNIDMPGSSLQIIIHINNPNSGDKTIFDNVLITATHDNDSQISLGADTEPTSIQSIENDSNNLFQVFDFTFTDVGAPGDGLATIINQLAINQGVNNEVSDWQNAIQGAKLFGPDIVAGGFEGTISTTGITFSATPLISISNGSSETYQLKIWLKTELSAISDNQKLDFALNYIDITTDAAGSTFGTGNETSDAISILIDATELSFQSVPDNILINTDFSAIVEAVDVNGNIDADFSSQITLSRNNGTGILSSAAGLAKDAVNGQISWSDLQYDTQENFDIKAVTTGITNNEKTSNSIFASEPASTLEDDFEDADLNGWGNAQDWTNSTDLPLNGTNSLKHNLESVDAQSYICHNLAALDLNAKTIIWRFNLKNGAWDPSSTSKFWFYLLANESNLNSTTVDGYAVGINLTGTNDLLTLWKVTDGVAEQALVTSTFNWNSSDMLGIEVRRSITGEWALYYDEDGNFDDMLNAGSATNTDYVFTDYCGLVFHIIASRAGQLWFDDISIGPDNNPPVLELVIATEANKLRLQFSEDLEQSTAESILNYSVNNSIGNPVTAILNVGNPVIVDLDFSSQFIAEQDYLLDVAAVQDLNENNIKDTTVQFSYTPFILDAVFVISKNELILDFSRNLDASSVSILTNYLVDNAIVNPETAVLQEDNGQIKLSFTTDFPENTELNLHIENLEDENNIVIDDTDTSFFWHNPLEYDLVFNEIMADPKPAVGLPEYEYLELYNKTNYTICLYDWSLMIGDNTKTFPLHNIQPDEYLIICSESAQAELDVYGNTIGIMGITELTNAGKEIALRTNLQLTIDTLNYTDAWYQDENKDNGGWSLERIDPDNTCGRLNNWKASIDSAGGTPGQQNSVYQSNIDNKLPQLIEIKLLSSTELELTFSEELFYIIASDTLNYMIDNSVYPTTAFLSGEEQNIVQIAFRNAFSIGDHSLKILNIEDLCSNSIVTLDTIFTYYPGNEFDIIINELMLDVSPEPNVLPPAKYIEIYNQTNVDINLEGWSLLIDDNIKYFADIQLPSKSYLILTDDDDTTLFSNYGKVHGIFSKSNLTASKGQISLFNRSNLLIDYLNYSSDWYGDDDRKSGGWSLERIDPLNYCGLNLNWLASNDYKGGTPGTANSILADNPDAETFEIMDIKVLSSSKLLVQFSKNLKEEQALNTNNYFVDNGPGNPMFVSFSDTSRATVILQFALQFTNAWLHNLTVENLIDFCVNTINSTQKEFTYYLIFPKVAYAESKNILKIIFSEEVEIVTAQQTENYVAEPDLGSPFKAYKHATNTNEVYLEFDIPFENGTNYSIHVEKVKDLNGNFIKITELGFSYFEPATNNIVLNEILFNPKSGGVDFVEIYNNSTYSIDLKHLKIAKRNDEGNIESIQALSEENSLLFPGTFLAITSDTSLTKADYPSISYERLIQLKSLPSYPDDQGTVVLLFQDTVIDEFSYSDEMHLALISDANGVSLERLHPDVETSDPQNWFSAAESVGFATPANRNSQFTEFSTENTDEIFIEPEVFSPDNDGYDDRTFIRYKFDEPGYVGNVSIYNSLGQLVKRIANNELLAAEGSFSWNGLYENNQRANIGIYIIYFEVFNLQGKVKRFKNTCVVAAKLK